MLLFSTLLDYVALFGEQVQQGQEEAARTTQGQVAPLLGTPHFRNVSADPSPRRLAPALYPGTRDDG